MRSQSFQFEAVDGQCEVTEEPGVTEEQTLLGPRSDVTARGA